jgi:hypothetical protein
MTVRAKFVCTEKTETKDGYRIKAQPVYAGSEENDKYFKFTPSGNLDLGTINEAAAAEYKPGQEFYLDMTQAVPVEAETPSDG